VVCATLQEERTAIRASTTIGEETMRRIHFLLFPISLIMLAFVLVGCQDPKERQLMSDGVSVSHYFHKSPDGSFTFEAGSFQEGTAIIGPNEMAFWVKDGTAYAVNDVAKKAAPDLESAPENIRYDLLFIAAAKSEAP
jgi:hypothetical protein